LAKTLCQETSSEWGGGRGYLWYKPCHGVRQVEAKREEISKRLVV
jgi:hypothetical protein